jgi:hypothetical protein
MHSKGFAGRFFSFAVRFRRTPNTLFPVVMKSWYGGYCAVMYKYLLKLKRSSWIYFSVH